jgi:thymidylate kinase
MRDTKVVPVEEKRPKLIVLEGPDGVGKSTQAVMLAKALNARLVSQPSTDNIVGYIRALAKTDPKFTALERQLLIAVSHTVDAFTKFAPGKMKRAVPIDGHGLMGVEEVDYPQDIVMDRSYISGLVYGKLTGMEPNDLGLIERILSDVYKANIADRFDVRVIFLTAQQRLDNPDKDVFESTIKWDDIRQCYMDQYRRSASSTRHGITGQEAMKWFSNDEILDVVNIGDATREELHSLLVGMTA